jgi:hypothetical protein
MKAAYFTSFILLFCFCAHVLQAQNILYVDDSNTTGIENGTQQHPFNTIKEGINAAVAGDQVMISQGLYVPDDSWSGNDQALFLKAGVKLTGEGRSNTFIEGIVVDQVVSSLSDTIEHISFNEFHFVRSAHSGPFTNRTVVQDCSSSLISVACAGGIAINDTTLGPNYGFLIQNNDLGANGIIEFKQGSGVADIDATGNTCGYIYLKSGSGYTYRILENYVQTGIFDFSGANTTTIGMNTLVNGLICDYSNGNDYGIEDEFIAGNTIICHPNSPAFLEVDEASAILVKSRSANIHTNEIHCTGLISGIRSYAGAPLNIEDNVIYLDTVTQASTTVEDGSIGILNYSGAGVVTGNFIKGGRTGYYSKAASTEFSNNSIINSYTGFYSSGGEAVHHNLIVNSYGDGMILDGLKGPIFSNFVNFNAGSGIRIIKPDIDLGGGADGSPGLNLFRGNGNYDIYIESSNNQADSVFAMYNVWDHLSTDSIAQFDIYDASHDPTLSKLVFIPIGTLGIPERIMNYGTFNLKSAPNPFQENTFITWTLSQPGQVNLRILDGTGKVIRDLINSKVEAGDHRIVFDSSNLAAGIYFCQLRVNGIFETIRMFHMK